MKTKEEILDQHLAKNKVMGSRKEDYIDDYGVHDVIGDAMDDYARQSIIDFLLWERQMQRDGFGPVILGRQPVDKVEIYFKEKATKP